MRSYKAASSVYGYIIVSVLKTALMPSDRDMIHNNDTFLRERKYVMKSFSESYKEAGVDVTAGYRAVELMKQYVQRT